MGATVQDNPAENRYEIRVDGEVAGFSTYRLNVDRIAIIHTEVGDAYRGQGLAEQLVEEELTDIRRRGLSVQPYCPLVRQYIAEHPAHLELVAARDRARFRLPLDETAT